MPESLQDRFQNLHEFVTQARINLDRNNWDYLIGGSETETTLARNRLALDSIGFRPRVLRDVSNVDCSRTLFRKKLRIPVLCSAVGSVQVFEPGGGATVAEATREFGNGMILSSGAHPGLEKTAEASGDGFKIFQLYVRGDTDWVDDHVRRAIDNGYDAFCLTIDTDSYSRRERDIAKRHQRRRVPVDDARIYQARFSWRDIERIKKNFDIPLVLKGISTAEDTKIAVEHGVDCVYVSNHGGRQLDQGVGTIECCRKWSKRSVGAPPSSLMAASAAAPTWSRRWPSAPTLSRLVGCIFTGLPQPAGPAWCGCSRSWKTRSASASRCSG
jgi:isopentenyl diphosphate isomerase/L-lactate dehydrogenase-like FMN-dependent dehydrogenase